VSPVRYALGFYIPKESILHSHRRASLKSYLCTGDCNSGNMLVCGILT
jgi:hypothetical protein